MRVSEALKIYFDRRVLFLPTVRSGLGTRVIGHSLWTQMVMGANGLDLEFSSIRYFFESY